MAPKVLASSKAQQHSHKMSCLMKHVAVTEADSALLGANMLVLHFSFAHTKLLVSYEVAHTSYDAAYITLCLLYVNM